MKKLTGILLALPLALLLTISCNDDQQDRMENDADTATSKIESEVSDIKDNFDDYRDETFVANVLEENAEILYLLQLAGTKGTASYVKDAAGHMKTEHNDLQQKFASYAQAHQVDYNHKDDYTDNLADKASGTDWDNDWNREMRNKHEKLIRKFERKTDNANNMELQTMATDGLPVLQQHLNTLEQYKQ